MPINTRVRDLTMGGPAIYRVTVLGEVRAADIAAFQELNCTCDRDGDLPAESILVGRLVDQAALSGLLNALYYLQFPLVSVECLEAGNCMELEESISPLLPTQLRCQKTGVGRAARSRRRGFETL